MSLKDLKLEFSDKQAVTGTSANSTNTLDLGLESNNLSGNVHGAGYFNVQCCKTVAPVAKAASGTITFAAVPTANDTITIGSTTKNIPSGGSSVKLWLHTASLIINGDYVFAYCYTTSNANLTLAQWISNIQNRVITDGYGNVFCIKQLVGTNEIAYTEFFNYGGTYNTQGTVSIASQTAEEQ